MVIVISNYSALSALAYERAKYYCLHVADELEYISVLCKSEIPKE